LLSFEHATAMPVAITSAITAILFDPARADMDISLCESSTCGRATRVAAAARRCNV